MTSKGLLDYSVVVPVLNEAGNIQTLVAQIYQVMGSLAGSPKFEVVYVDDGSTDKTPTELASAAANYKNFVVVNHLKTCGQSQALITGIDSAAGEWIITLDGDGQNDPADIPKLLMARNEALEKELNHAKRFLYVGHRLKRADSLVRRYQSWLANDIRGWLLGDHTPDSGCGLKMFRRDLFLELPRFDAIHRFLPAFILRAGGRVISIEVSHRSRLHGQSKYGLWKRFIVSVVDLFGVLWLMNRHSRPTIYQKKDKV